MPLCPHLSVESMPYNELRKDYLLARWVVIAMERARRPTDLAKPKPAQVNTSVCPLCVGNENMTPPAIMLYQKVNGNIKRLQDSDVGERSKDWLVRVIPNLFPAFPLPKVREETTKIFRDRDFGYAIGHHEVIVESPIHNEEPTDAKLDQLELVIKAYIDRLNELRSKPYVKYVSIFRNYGREAGASLSHAHSQIISTPMIPTTLQQEQEASKSFFEEHEKCVFCDIIEKEAQNSRNILENGDFLVFAPYASINPMEFWIIPKKHSPNILNLAGDEASMFARTLQTSLRALKEVVNDPPYNFGFHISIDPNAVDYYHWHLEVYPKLATWAGFEKSTGVYINTVPPESAAESLKKSIKA